MKKRNPVSLLFVAAAVLFVGTWGNLVQAQDARYNTVPTRTVNDLGLQESNSQGQV